MSDTFTIYKVYGFYICKHDLFENVYMTFTDFVFFILPDDPCPDDDPDIWEYVPTTRKCIHRSRAHEFVTYEGARDICKRRLDASLMVIHNDAEREFLNQSMYVSQYNLKNSKW